MKDYKLHDQKLIGGSDYATLVLAGLVQTFRTDELKIYKAGQMGCIVQLIGKE